MKNFSTIYKRLEHLNYLIKNERTGSVKELARKMVICERTVHNLRAILEYHGKKISFSYHKNSYCYNDRAKTQLNLESFYINPGFRCGLYNAVSLCSFVSEVCKI